MLVAASACGGQDRGSPQPDAGPDTTAPPVAPIALVMTEDGLAAVPVGTSEPLWVLDGAVAAPDGSAIFATVPSAEAGVEVARIDPRTGAAHRISPLRRTPLGVHVAAVEPGGGRVALAVSVVDRTEVIDIDIARGVDHAKTTSFEGDVEPEAYSLDRNLLFAARTFGDRYHVHVLELATGEQWPTVGPDKTLPPEDMYGSVVQAVLSPDGAQLATLYRDSTETDHTAFVHLLDLERGQTVCIDLYVPFGTGGPGTDALEPGGRTARWPSGTVTGRPNAP